MTSSSYLLENELLGSARRTIDANSNSSLVTNGQVGFYRSPYAGYTPTSSSTIGFQQTMETVDLRKNFAELQDQINLFKQELAKKDKLIQELSAMQDPTKLVIHDVAKIDKFVNHDRLTLDTLRRDFDQCRTKVDGLSHDLREANIKISTKEERINEMKYETDALKRDNEMLNEVNNQLRIRIRELETNVNSFDSANNKSSLTISSLQRDAKEKQEQIIESQSRIRILLEEKESIERKSAAFMNKLQTVFLQLGVTLGTDFGQPHASAFEKLVNRIADINAENTSIKGKMIEIEEKNRILDTENKANRATLQQMSNQLSSYENGNYNHRQQLDSLRAERDAALHEKETIKQELELVKSRLDSIQKAWQNSRTELDSRETKFSASELQLRQIENELSYAKSCLDAFKQQIAQLLSDGYVKVEAKEEEIKEKVQLLMQSSKDRGIFITNLQNQKEQLSKQLKDQLEINCELDNRRKLSEAKIIELENRLTTLDNTFTTHEVYRENLKHDKAKFLHFVERLGSIMKIENISHELGFELNPDVILARAEQLMKLENDSIVDQKTSIYSLQRRIKQLKEQLENKDVHMDLLRKKVIALEEGRNAKSELEKEIDDHVILSKKLKSKVETLTQHVNQLKIENGQLKAQINDVQTFQGRLGERENEIRRLYEDIHKLEQIRDRQAVKINSLQERIHSVDDEASRSLISSDNAVRTLSNELRFLKETLQQVTAREQSLIDFRALIGRMLGLDVKTLSVPDYEITARLERLLLTIQSGPIAVPVVPVNGTIHTIHSSATNRNHNGARPATSLAATSDHRSPASLPRPRAHRSSQQMRSANVRRRSPSPVHRSEANGQRARSLSPLQVGLDPRTY